MIELKFRVLATILHLFSNHLEKANKPEDYICDQYDRLETVAEASVIGAENNICSETNINEKLCWKGDINRLAFILGLLAGQETSYSERIHKGKCYINECDPVFKFDKNGNKYLAYHRAHSLWQIHQQYYVPYDEWNSIVGVDLETTTRAATVAGRLFAMATNRCRTEIGGYSLYATGKRCVWSGAYGRLHQVNRFMKKTEDPEWVQEQLSIKKACNNIVYD